MLFSVLGLVLLQGNSHGQCCSFICCLYLLVYNTFLLHCKVFLMPWSYPTPTLEVSWYPRTRIPHRRGCLWQMREESPDPSAALVIPTRTKNASTTAIWISSGSTHQSKAHVHDRWSLSVYNFDGRASLVNGNRTADYIMWQLVRGFGTRRFKRWQVQERNAAGSLLSLSFLK